MKNIITDSVVWKTYQLTEDKDIHTLADDVKDKFLTLNNLFSRVHELSHKDSVRKDEMNDIEDSISMYVSTGDCFLK